MCDEVLRSRMARLAPREYGGKAKEKEYERSVLLFPLGNYLVSRTSTRASASGTLEVS